MTCHPGGLSENWSSTAYYPLLCLGPRAGYWGTSAQGTGWQRVTAAPALSVKTPTLGPRGLGSNPDSTNPWLWALGEPSGQ